MDSNLRAENRMLKEQLEIIVNENEKLKEQINEYQKALDETTSEKIDLQQENKQLKDFLGLLEANIRINHDDIQINLYKKLLQIFKDLKDILGDKENE